MGEKATHLWPSMASNVAPRDQNLLMLLHDL